MPHYQYPHHHHAPTMSKKCRKWMLMILSVGRTTILASYPWKPSACTATACGERSPRSVCVGGGGGGRGCVGACVCFLCSCWYVFLWFWVCGCSYFECSCQFQVRRLHPDLLSICLPYGLVVRIRRSHRRGPGSIPGVGTFLFFSFLMFVAIGIYRFNVYTVSPLCRIWRTHDDALFSDTLRMRFSSSRAQSLMLSFSPSRCVLMRCA